MKTHEGVLIFHCLGDASLKIMRKFVTMSEMGWGGGIFFLSHLILKFLKIQGGNHFFQNLNRSKTP